MGKILALDDDRINQEMFKVILQKSFPEYQILIAENGTQGLAMIRKELPDTILLDIMLPDADGIEICRQLKSDDNTKMIPILMVSALGNDTNVRVRALKAGADGFISKPFNRSELVALIDMMLRIRNADIIHQKRFESLQQIKEYQYKLKKLNSALILTEELERKKIAEYLHDGLGATLAIANMKLSSLVEKDIDPKIQEVIADSSDLIQDAISKSRSLTNELSPPILYELGLIPALKWKLEVVEKQGNFLTTFEYNDEFPEIDDEMRIFLFRIISELLHNILKHAGADHVSLSLTKEQNHINLLVLDNGKGMDKNPLDKMTQPGGFGLFNLHERLDSVEGSLLIDSKIGKGTKISVKVPLK